MGLDFRTDLAQSREWKFLCSYPNSFLRLRLLICKIWKACVTGRDVACVDARVDSLKSSRTSSRTPDCDESSTPSKAGGESFVGNSRTFSASLMTSIFSRLWRLLSRPVPLVSLFRDVWS